MKKTLFLLTISFVFLFCKKETTTGNDIWMTYQMTQCDDPWQQEADYFSKKEATLKSFLEKKGITVLELKIVTDCSKSAVCAACSCAGCDNASVRVDAGSVTAMEKLKFTKK
jgi:hypothetical protein